MGKKRRLKSAKGKFRVKHNTHPRVRHLNAQEEVVEEVVVAASPEPEVVVVAAAPKPEVVLQEEKVEEAPKAAPKRKRTKKTPTKRRRAKKTVTQDITT